MSLYDDGGGAIVLRLVNIFEATWPFTLLCAKRGCMSSDASPQQPESQCMQDAAVERICSRAFECPEADALMMLQANENADLATSASVDIARLFKGLDIASVRELSLTASHTAAQRSWPNRDFAAGRPMFSIEPALAAEAAAANASILVPDGFDQQGRWVDNEGLKCRQVMVAGLGTPVAGLSGQAFVPSQPLDDWEAGGALWQRHRPVVILQPSEIRTFEVRLRQQGAASEQ